MKFLAIFLFCLNSLINAYTFYNHSYNSNILIDSFNFPDNYLIPLSQHISNKTINRGESAFLKNIFKDLDLLTESYSLYPESYKSLILELTPVNETQIGFLKHLGVLNYRIVLLREYFVKGMRKFIHDQKSEFDVHQQAINLFKPLFDTTFKDQGLELDINYINEFSQMINKMANKTNSSTELNKYIHQELTNLKIEETKYIQKLATKSFLIWYERFGNEDEDINENSPEIKNFDPYNRQRELGNTLISLWFLTKGIQDDHQNKDFDFNRIKSSIFTTTILTRFWYDIIDYSLFNSINEISLFDIFSNENQLKSLNLSIL